MWKMFPFHEVLILLTSETITSGLLCWIKRHHIMDAIASQIIIWFIVCPGCRYFKLHLPNKSQWVIPHWCFTAPFGGHSCPLPPVSSRRRSFTVLYIPFAIVMMTSSHANKKIFRCHCPFVRAIHRFTFRHLPVITDYPLPSILIIFIIYALIVDQQRFTKHCSQDKGITLCGHLCSRMSSYISDLKLAQWIIYVELRKVTFHVHKIIYSFINLFFSDAYTIR